MGKSEEWVWLVRPDKKPIKLAFQSLGILNLGIFLFQTMRLRVHFQKQTNRRTKKPGACARWSDWK